MSAVISLQLCRLCRSPEIGNPFQLRKDWYHQCSGCGLVFRAVIDTEDEKNFYQSNTYLAEHSRHRLELREVVFQETLADLDAMKVSGRILDLGCGDGRFLGLAQSRGWHSYGVELSPSACEQAKKSGAEIFQGELAEAYFPDDFFDVVTMHNVLDHIPDPMTAVREIGRVLKPGGRLFVRIPNGSFHVRLLRTASTLERFLVIHSYCFTPQALRRCLELAHFTDIVIENAGLTAGDPYHISPAGRDAGMQAIKTGLYLFSQAVYYLSGRTVVIGPSIKALAKKPSEAQTLV